MNAAVTAMHCGIWGPKLGQKEMLYFLEPLKWTKLRRDAAAGDGATESSQLQLEAASRQHLLLRGWGSILLSEGGWFDSPGTFDTEPQTAPDVLVSHHQWVGLSQLLSVRTDSQSHHQSDQTSASASDRSLLIHAAVILIHKLRNQKTISTLLYILSAHERCMMYYCSSFTCNNTS